MFRPLFRRLGYRMRRSSRRGPSSPPASPARFFETLESRNLFSASLWTDALDYAPGSTALISGSGYGVGEAITIDLDADNGLSESHGLTDGGEGDLDGLADGNFTFAWLCDPGGAYLNATILATATGLASGEVASTTFTDSGNDSPDNITVANGWTPGGSNGVNPATVVTCEEGFIITKIAIKTGGGGGFVIENLTGVAGDENEGSSHSPVIDEDGYLGKGLAFTTTEPLSGAYYSVVGIGTDTVTVTAVNGAGAQGGGLSHVDYFCEEDPNVGGTQLSITGMKFYDSNVDSINNDGVGIENWQIFLDEDNDGLLDWVDAGDLNGIWDAGEGERWTLTDVNGVYSFTGLTANTTYSVCEKVDSLPGTWVATTATCVEVNLAETNVEGIDFGNVQLGAGGGMTLGFWSNKNGSKLAADDLDVLNDLNLVDANGDAAGGANGELDSVKELNSFLLSANANNMANMLSAQLAAMALNVENEKVNGDALVYAADLLAFEAANGDIDDIIDGTGNGDIEPLTTTGFISINSLIALANEALAADPTTITADLMRAYQEALKNALDLANNNLNFLLPPPA